MAKNVSTTTVRVYLSTNDELDSYVKKANAKRIKAGLMKITKTHVIDLAIRNLGLEAGLK